MNLTNSDLATQALNEVQTTMAKPWNTNACYLHRGQRLTTMTHVEWSAMCDFCTYLPTLYTSAF